MSKFNKKRSNVIGVLLSILFLTVLVIIAAVIAYFAIEYTESVGKSIITVTIAITAILLSIRQFIVFRLKRRSSINRNGRVYLDTFISKEAEHVAINESRNQGIDYKGDITHPQEESLPIENHVNAYHISKVKKNGVVKVRDLKTKKKFKTKWK